MLEPTLARVEGGNRDILQQVLILRKLAACTLTFADRIQPGPELGTGVLSKPARLSEGYIGISPEAHVAAPSCDGDAQNPFAALTIRLPEMQAATVPVAPRFTGRDLARTQSVQCHRSLSTFVCSNW